MGQPVQHHPNTEPNTLVAAGGLAFTVGTSLKVRPPAVPLHPDRIAQVDLVVPPVADAVVAHDGCAVMVTFNMQLHLTSP